MLLLRGRYIIPTYEKRETRGVQHLLLLYIREVVGVVAAVVAGPVYYTYIARHKKRELRCAVVNYL